MFKPLWVPSLSDCALLEAALLDVGTLAFSWIGPNGHKTRRSSGRGTPRGGLVSGQDNLETRRRDRSHGFGRASSQGVVGVLGATRLSSAWAAKVREMAWACRRTPNFPGGEDCEV
jgi:hypothetical protein